MGQRTDTGKVRRRNEDDLGYWVPSDLEEAQRKGSLYIVADGMGGHLAGDRASELAVSIITKTYYENPSLDIEESLCHAIEATNARIHEEATEMTKAGMGTTVVCAVIRGQELYIAHVGDSRAYLARGQAIQQLTVDHSWVEDQVRAGIISQEDARTHPQRNIITRSLGSRPGIEVDTQRRVIQEGDLILLCSDGLSGPVRDEEIRKVILNYEPQEACDKLIDLANENGGPDNVTAIVVRVDEVAMTPPALVPERYKGLPAAAPALAGMDTETALSVRTVPSVLPTVESAPSVSPVALPQSQIASSRLKLAVLGLLAIVTVALCAISIGLWGLGPLSPLGLQPTPTTVLAAITATSPKTPLQGNQDVATSTAIPTATPLPPTPTPPLPTSTPSPSPTATETPPPTPTLASLAVPSPTFTPKPPVVSPLPTPAPPLALVVDSAAWPQESPITMTTSLTNSPQVPLTVTVNVVSALPITTSTVPAGEVEGWTLLFSSSQPVTFTAPVTVELNIAVSPDSSLQRTLNLDRDLLGGPGLKVNIRLGSDISGVGWVQRKFNLLLAAPYIEADQRPVLLLQAVPQSH